MLITGANTGIGRAAAEALAARGHRLYLACRSEEKTLPVIDAIARKTRLTADGFELTFGVNHLGHFLLTALLLDRLKQRAPARIVNVSSIAHYQAKGIEWEAVRKPTKNVTALPEYAVSKLANVLFTQELARRLVGTGVTSYALHPGAIGSDIWSRRLPRFVRGPVNAALGLLLKSTSEGATTQVWCATAEGLASESGKYYDNCQEKEPSAVATPELAAELWERSEEWTN